MSKRVFMTTNGLETMRDAFREVIPSRDECFQGAQGAAEEKTTQGGTSENENLRRARLVLIISIMTPSAPYQGARRLSLGFSLGELLFGITVLAVVIELAAIGLSSSTRRLVHETSCRQSASSLSALSTCAQVAGVDPVARNNLGQAVAMLLNGIEIKTGSFAGREFKAAPISSEDLPEVMKYLRIENGELHFVEPDR